LARGQDDRAGKQNTNLLASTQTLSSEEPSGLYDSIQPNCMMGRRKKLLAVVLIAKYTLSFSEPSVWL
jgi:hypothetical protein